MCSVSEKKEKKKTAVWSWENRTKEHAWSQLAAKMKSPNVK